MNLLQPFSEEEVERSRSYHRPLRPLLLADLAVGLGWPAALAFALPLGWVAQLPWATATAALAVATAVGAAVARTPVSAWRHRHERAWVLSDQAWSGWAADRAKGLGVGAALATRRDAAARLERPRPAVGVARWPPPPEPRSSCSS